MNITEEMRGQAGAKFIYALLLLVGIDWIIGWAVSPAIIVAGLVTLVVLVSLLAVVYTTGSEWTRLGINEEYGQAHFARMMQQKEKNLYDRLDAIGREAYDELQKAIERLEETEAGEEEDA